MSFSKYEYNFSLTCFLAYLFTLLYANIIVLLKNKCAVTTLRLQGNQWAILSYWDQLKSFSKKVGTLENVCASFPHFHAKLEVLPTSCFL